MATRKSPQGSRTEELIKREAKALLQSVRSGDEGALDRVTQYFKDPANATLQQIQLVVARDHGFDSWNKLKGHVSRTGNPGLRSDLHASMTRTFNDAKAKQHGSMTIEHLLLALLDIEDVVNVLVAVGCDVARLRPDLKEFIDANVPLVPPSDTEHEVQPARTFKRVMQRAVYHVQTSGRSGVTEVTGANVLVTIFSEQESYAVRLLTQQNITQSSVVNYLKSHG